MTPQYLLYARVGLAVLGAVLIVVLPLVGGSFGGAAAAAFVLVIPGMITLQILEARAAHAARKALEQRLTLMASQIETLTDASSDAGNEAVMAEIKVLKTLLGQLFSKQGAGLAAPAKAPAPAPKSRRVDDEVDDIILDLADESDLDDALLDDTDDTDDDIDAPSSAADARGQAPSTSDAKAKQAGAGQVKNPQSKQGTAPKAAAKTPAAQSSTTKPETAAKEEPAAKKAAPPPLARRRTTPPKPKPGSRPIRVIKKTRELLKVVETGLSENRVDLYLQPIVKLPQRRAVHYECYSRVRDDEGRIILPRQYLKLASEKGMLGTIDNLLLFRLIQLVRRLGPRHADMRFFCNLAGESIADEEFFPQFIDYMRTSREFADRIIFEIAQEDYMSMMPEARKQLEDLNRVGFMFSLDSVTQLGEEFSLESLGTSFFAYLKMDASFMGSGFEGGKLDEFRASLAEQNITLIASRVESEDDVLIALDGGVEMAQGYQVGLPQSLEQLENDL